MEENKQYTRRMVNIHLPDATEEEKQTYAEEFCEGNEDLKNFLLFLWHNNINTIGCCAGHKKVEYTVAETHTLVKDDYPYICFYIDNFSDNQIECFLSNYLYTNPKHYFFQKYIENDSVKNILLVQLPFNCLFNKGWNFKKLKRVISKILNNNCKSKIDKLSKENKQLIKDIILLKNTKKEIFISNNTFENVKTVQLYKSKWVKDNKSINVFRISINTEESLNQFNSIKNADKHPKDLEAHILLSKNTYSKPKTGLYYIWKDETFKQVDKEYVKTNNLIDYWDYMGSLNVEYSHQEFVDRLEHIKNHNLLDYYYKLKK